MKRGTRSLGARLHHPVAGRHKYRGLLIQDGGKIVLCTKIVTESKDVKTGSNLAENTTQGYSSKKYYYYYSKFVTLTYM
jgi:hypothetical protein